MSAIRSENTKPELIIRRALHRAGFRFRLHRRDLPGRPDIVLPKYCGVIFAHGCFWHGHECPRFRWPSGDRADFWRNKIIENQRRDEDVAEALKRMGWRFFVVWECALVGKDRRSISSVIAHITAWLNSERQTGTLSGIPSKSSGPQSEEADA